MIHKLPSWVWLGAAVLAFSAGMVNVIALLSFAHEAATHMTGIASRASIILSEGNIIAAGKIFTMLAAFLAGAFMSGIIIRDGQLRMGRRYGAALTIESLLLFGSAYGLGIAASWGEHLAAMAAGLQNAMASTYSGTIVRTTHLTGILTDIGALAGNWAAGIRAETKRLKLLTVIFVSFVMGGVAGAFAHKIMAGFSMLAPACIIGLSAIGYEFMRRRIK